MSTRRLFAVAAIVILLSAVIVLWGQTVWSDRQDQGAAPQPTGQSGDAAERARAELASHLKVPPESISIVTVKEHTWNDASLGLPEPGMMYAQVITPGYIVTLRHDGQTYVYHVAGQSVKLNPEGR